MSVASQSDKVVRSRRVAGIIVCATAVALTSLVAPGASATVRLFDQAMVAAVVIAIAYIASIMVGWL